MTTKVDMKSATEVTTMVSQGSGTQQKIVHHG